MGNINRILKPSSFANSYNIAVIGGGPGGIMAAISARNANPKSRICILEKSNSLGRKLLLTGNGRCNYTTSLDLNELINSFGKQGRFFFEAFNSFSNKDLIEFFKLRGILPEYENDYKVFPKDGNSITILNCLKNELLENKIDIIYDFEVQSIVKYLDDNDSRNYKKDIPNEVFKITSSINKNIFSKKVILATGGLSYPQTGSSGDGYEFARSFGHNIIQFSPSIIPILSKYVFSLNLQGVSLKKISIAVVSDKKIIKKETGDLIFTHFGISGPAAQNLGNIIFKEVNEGRNVYCSIDLCPDITLEGFLKKYKDLRALNSKKEINTIIKIIFADTPNELLLKIFSILKIDMHQKTGNIEKKDILKIINFSKNFIFKTEGTLPIREATVTEGGVSIKEIEPKTMESRIVKNLYFAGEIIEMQGPEGGFNLQKAFSTGWLAGKAAALDIQQDT